MSRAATNATTSPVTRPKPTSWSTNCHQMKSLSCSAAAAKREDRGQRQAVVQAGLEVERVANQPRHARVGDHRGREHGVGGREQRPQQERLGPAEVGERVGGQRDQAGGERHRRARACAAAGARPPGASPPPPRARRGTGSGSGRPPPAPWTKPEVGSRSSTPRPPSPEQEARDHERRGEREEAAPGEAGHQRPAHQQHAEDGERRLEGLDPGGERGHARRQRLASTRPAASRAFKSGYAERPMRARSPRSASLPVLLAAAPAAGGAAPRRARSRTGWEVRAEPAAPAPPQAAPPEETAPDGHDPGGPAGCPAARAAREPGDWRAARVPSVFDPRALAALYPGQRAALPGALRRARDAARLPLAAAASRACGARPTVFLNGRRLGRNTDPYTPFDGRGPRPAARAGRTSWWWSWTAARTRGLLEGWWNWGGIVRPVRLDAGGPRAPPGPGHDVAGALPRAGPALPRRAADRRRCSSAGAPRESNPTLEVRLRSPGGRTIAAHLPARPGSARGAQAAPAVGARARARSSGRPSGPQLYSARITLRDARRGAAGERRRVGLRSVNGQARAPVPEQPPGAAARRLDPRGHARPRRGAHQRGHGHDRERAEGAWARTSPARTTS